MSVRRLENAFNLCPRLCVCRGGEKSSLGGFHNSALQVLSDGIHSLRSNVNSLSLGKKREACHNS